MNDKDIFELFQNGLTARNTSDSYSRLCNFVSAMRCGQYYPISDEDIHRGVECEKAQAKAKTKILFMSFPDDIKKAMDAAIELKYAQSLQQLLYYNHIQKP
jgi:hypothetical protein